MKMLHCYHHDTSTHSHALSVARTQGLGLWWAWLAAPSDVVTVHAPPRTNSLVASVFNGGPVALGHHFCSSVHRVPGLTGSYMWKNEFSSFLCRFLSSFTSRFSFLKISVFLSLSLFLVHSNAYQQPTYCGALC